MPVSASRRALLAVALLLVAGAATFVALDDRTEDGIPDAIGQANIDPDALEVPVRTLEVLGVVPHRADAFTQGLLWDERVLYESTGRVGESTVAALDPQTGEIREVVDVNPNVFAEGLALVDDRLIQLTWQDGVAYLYDQESLQVVGEFSYEGEGWGLCHDGDRLVMSDGSAVLTFRNPNTFEETGDVAVTLDGERVGQLNELECVGDRVYANIWKSDAIVEIDPATGEVTAVIDAGTLVAQLDPAPQSDQAVLNGIAHDPEAGTFWLTGKLWPQMFEVRFIDA